MWPVHSFAILRQHQDVTASYEGEVYSGANPYINLLFDTKSVHEQKIHNYDKTIEYKQLAEV